MTIMTDSKLGRLVLMRHGQTSWALEGKHTGRTNIPLTAVGRSQARDAAPLLRGFNFTTNPEEQVFVSPLLRAQQTAKQVGFNRYQTSQSLAEWDYGQLEGHTSAELSSILGHDFNLWVDGTNINTSGLPTVETPVDEEGNRIEIAHLPGETIDAVAARARRFIDHINMDLHMKKDILVVAHSHILRVLTCCWLGLEPKMGGRMVLDTASVSVLGIHAGQKVLFEWNKTLRGADE